MPRVRKLALALAGAALLASGTTHALTLGDIALKSTLEQPLDAEIELLDARGLPITDVRPDLATALEFNKIGIPRPAHLEGLHFKAVQRPNGRTVINVTSDKPINEPYLNFLVEVRWPSGRLLREYTLLLDAPIYAQGSTLPKSARLPVIDAMPDMPKTSSRLPPLPMDDLPLSDVSAGNSKPARTTAPKVATAAPVVASAPLPKVPAAPKVPKAELPPTDLPPVEAPKLSSDAPLDSKGGDEYRTQRNDTLWEIARQMRNDRVLTVQQTMLAIQQLNPDAFNNGNINRLKVGQVLRLPDEQQIRTVAAAQAVAEVERQNRDWRTSARSLAETNTPRTLNATPEQPAAELPVVRAPKADSLRLLAAEGGQSTRGSEKAPEGIGQGLRDQLALAEEQLATGQREKEELSGRLSDLQGQLDTLQRLIELKDTQLARLQTNANTPTAAADTKAAPVVGKAAVSASLPNTHPATEAQSSPEKTTTNAPTTADVKPSESAIEDRAPWLWGAAGLGALLVALLWGNKRRQENTQKQPVPERVEDMPLDSADDSPLPQPSGRRVAPTLAAENSAAAPVSAVSSVKMSSSNDDEEAAQRALAAALAEESNGDLPDNAELSARLATEIPLEPPVLNDRAPEADKNAAPAVDDGDAAFEAFMANTVRQVIRPLQEAGNTVSPEAFSFEGRSLAVALEAAQKLEQARDGLARGDTTSVRTLLEAVLREGDSQQQQEARALLGRLG